jgi:glycerol uptake facilitator protein
MSAYLAEMIGTMLLVIFGNGVVAGVVLNKTKSQNGGWIVITMGWGFAVAFAVYTVGSISGAHVNPAVTFGLAAAGAFSWSLVPGYVFSQMVGGILGAVFVYLYYLPHWEATDDPSAKLAAYSTSPAIRHTFSNFLSEFLGTFILLFGLMAIGANKFADGVNPLIIGFFITAIGISLGGTTGYAINPARDLGPRIAHAFLPIAGKGSSDWGYAWIPVVGPIAGGVAGALVYSALFG